MAASKAAEVPRMRSDEVLHCISRRLPQDAFFAEVRNGPSQYVAKGALYKLDAIHVRKSWSRPCITGYEVKVSRSDFLHDTKWPGYLPYCNELYFACPYGLIQAEEVDARVGLIWCRPDGSCLTRKKALFRDIETPVGMLYFLIMSAVPSHRHPFFSSDREFFEAFVADKAERRDLGRRVKGRIRQVIKQATASAEEATLRAERDHDDAERWRAVSRLWREAGRRQLFTWNWEHEVREALAGEATPEVQTLVRQLIDQSARLGALVGIKLPGHNTSEGVVR